jgi:signal transduction histidine kinase
MSDEGQPSTHADQYRRSVRGERLSVQLQRPDLARHLAFFFDTPDEQLRVAATFVRVGLDGGNRCLYFVDGNTRSAVEAAFRAAGIDVEKRVEAGDLVIQAGSDAYEEADFDPDRLITHLEDACHDSVDEEYEGVWVAGEVSWCFHTALDYDHVVDFEAGFDAVCSDVPVVALCQYDLTRFSEESVAKALWTHRQFIYRERICENPFYVPPGEFESTGSASVDVNFMLEQAYGLAEATREVDRREQRLTVVDRVLRHDVRNHLNVAHGILDLVRETNQLDDEVDQQLATAADHLDGVVQAATKARFVQRTLDTSSVTQVPLRSAIDSAIDRVVSGYPDVEVEVDLEADVEDASGTNATDGGVDEGLTVTADTALDIALTELLLYAVDAQRAPARVGLRVVEQSPRSVRIDLSYPGPPVPKTDRKALQNGVETPLNHCTGLSLWLVKWIVENGRGRVEYPHSTSEPIRIRLCRHSHGD